jgi:hypothetical protein
MHVSETKRTRARVSRSAIFSDIPPALCNAVRDGQA